MPQRIAQKIWSKICFWIKLHKNTFSNYRFVQFGLAYCLFSSVFVFWFCIFVQFNSFTYFDFIYLCNCLFVLYVRNSLFVIFVQGHSSSCIFFCIWWKMRNRKYFIFLAYFSIIDRNLTCSQPLDIIKLKNVTKIWDM